MRVPLPAARIRTVGALTRKTLKARGRPAGPGREAGRKVGGQGLEPRFSGPKPDVLPLDDPPGVRGRIVAARTGFRTAKSGQWRLRLSFLQLFLHLPRRPYERGESAVVHCP